MVAFRFPHDTDETVETVGMTLRDYFAAKAMAAYCSSDDWRADMSDRETASAAYLMADAMLKVRKA